MQSPKIPSSSPLIRYTVLGALFGVTFPLGSMLILALEQGLPITLQTAIAIHQSSILQWLVDTAPLVLAAFAFLAGQRQEQVIRLNQQLSGSLNERDQLIGKLNQSYQSLEAEAEKSLAHLRTAAQIAQHANASRDLQQLLDQTARLVSQQFGFYHTGIFLNDTGEGGVGRSGSRPGSDGRYALLTAASSEGGQRMLKRGHRLRIGSEGFGVGIVGYVADRGEAKIALDVGSDAVFFDNPDLPETRSEMALPIKIAGKTTGVLDVQSTQPAAFTEKDLTVMAIIADSLASAIENAHLFTQVRDSLDEIRSLHQQYLERAWVDALISQDTPGALAYTYTPSAAAASEPAQLTAAQGSGAGVEHDAQPPITDQSKSGQVSPLPEQSQDQVQHELRSIQIPIKLRDQVIGQLAIETDPRSEMGTNANEWMPEELALIQSVANQAALALENARLLDETRRRAERERITANVSSKVWTFSDIDTILRTALHELGTSLGAAQGSIEVEIEGGDR